MAGLMGQSQKKIIRKTLPIHFLNGLKIKNKYIGQISRFYKKLKQKKKEKKNLNLNLLTIQKKIIGVFTGFKKKIRLRGIGYKFLLDQGILTLRIGSTHTFSIILSSLLYYKLNKKKTKLLLKYKDFNKLTLFLSSFQNIKKPNTYN